jgi:hypothetical protein
LPELPRAELSRWILGLDILPEGQTLVIKALRDNEYLMLDTLANEDPEEFLQLPEVKDLKRGSKMAVKKAIMALKPEKVKEQEGQEED